MAKPSFLDCMISIPATKAARDHCRGVIAITGAVVLGYFFILRRRW